MKYSVVALAVAGALLSAQAMADVRVSGRIKPSLLSENIETTRTNLVNGKSYTTKLSRPEFLGNSRIRFSGKENINKDWTFLYALEYNIYIDTDKDEATEKTQFSSRSTYAGVESKEYGRFRFGRQSLPGEDVDLVNMSSGDAFGTYEPFSFSGDIRTNNSFQYASPYFGRGGKNRVKFQYGMDEGDTKLETRVYSFRANGRRSSEKRDIAHIQFLHADEKLSYGGFYTRAGDDFSALRGAVRYDIPNGKFGFGVMGQVADYNSSKDEIGAMASVSYYHNDNVTLYAQAGHAKNYQGFADGKHSTFSIGGSKMQKLQSGKLLTYGAVSYDKLKELGYASSDDVSSGFAGAKYQLINMDSKALGFEVGLQYSF